MVFEGWCAIQKAGEDDDPGLGHHVLVDVLVGPGPDRAARDLLENERQILYIKKVVLVFGVCAIPDVAPDALNAPAVEDVASGVHVPDRRSVSEDVDRVAGNVL